MRRELLLTILMCLGAGAAPGHANLLGAPSFTADESHKIERNELLREILPGDPWLVRLMLDIVETSPHASTLLNGDVGRDANPDLDVAPRDAQGIVQWNELIRRARRAKEQITQTGDISVGRSAEATLDLIELARRAKLKKAGATQ